MAAIHDLLAQIADKALRERIEHEVDKLTKTKKFGLVFEQHLPECTPLYDMPIKQGVNIMLRNSKEDKSLYVVLRIDGENAVCGKKDNLQDQVVFSLKDIVRVAEFGEPIYPYLEQIDSICNAPDNDLWHTLIEADNYHALQLLEYLYAGKVDCIYIDPPYNTGAKDWKYNNDYIDGNDTYRHSKWLSFMEKRLVLAKHLLNPENSALIITIDEKEYLHLGCLLEQLFPEARIQMISSVINPAGAGKGNKLFARTDEYIFIVQFGNSVVIPESREVENVPVIWDTLRRSSLANARGRHGKGACGPNQFYPIYVDDNTGRIRAIGDPIAEDVDRRDVQNIEGCTAVFPVRPDGTEMNWGVSAEKAKEIWAGGYLRAGKHTPETPQQYVISYVTGGNIRDIESGIAVIDGYNEDGSVIAHYPKGRDKMPTTNWNRPSHDAQRYGTNIITPIIGGRFNYPKSLYAVKDCLGFFVSEKKDSLILDFFAGSGTTMHAVNLLNEEDGGHRRCICVTNNEVSEAEAKKLSDKGIRAGDKEWLELGIARYVTWPRIKGAITGKSVEGKTLEGNYLDSTLKMGDGFKTNAVFFKLGFLDKTAIALGMQFSEILPVLWMKAGAIGRCPQISNRQKPSMLVLPENKFAVLIDENSFAEFAKIIAAEKEIQTVFLITNYDVNYRAMLKMLEVKNSYQLYRDYLDNFRINHGRN